MSAFDWSLATKLANAGFDLDFISLSNSLGIQQGPLALGKKDAEQQNSKEKISSQLKMAGQLWSICKDYEMELPSVKTPDTFDGRMRHAKVCRESDVLLGRLKVTCADIWLGIYQSRKNEWPINVLLDLISWLLEACESLIGLKQWSTVNSLLAQVIQSTGTLEEIVQDAFAGDSPERIFLSDDDSLPVSECERACLLWVKAKVMSFHVLMQLKGATDWKLSHDQLQDILIGISGRYMKVSMFMEYRRASTSVAVQFINSCQYEEAIQILKSLLKFHKPWRATEDSKLQHKINHIIALNSRKCSLLLAWCHFHVEESFQAGSLADPFVADLPGVMREWLQKLDALDSEYHETCLDASRHLDQYLKQNVKAPHWLESCAWACSQLMCGTQWKWMPRIISQYAHTHSINKGDKNECTVQFDRISWYHMCLQITDKFFW